MQHLWTGRDLRAERARAGLTQAELGRLIGVSARRVATIESQYRVSAAFAERVRRALRLARRRTERQP
jgi:transcriptional regulator with XRE-family HTH domain